MEREADRIGYGVMTQAGFAPEGFVSMFGKLEAASRLNDNGDWPYLRSHPLTTERMADMQQRQQNLPRGTPPPPDLEALMMAARARVESRPGVDMLRTWAKQPEQPGFAQQPLATRAGALYAAAIAGAELRDLPRAQALAAQLAQAVAGDARAARQARLLQAELALQAGQNESALQWLAPLRPDSDAAPQSQSGRAALLMRAQAQIHGGQAAEAASALQPWLSDHPRDAGAWQALAQAWAAQGQTLRQLRAEGEVQMAHMDYAGAVDRWRAAQDFTRQQPSGSVDLIDASIVDARLREGRELLKQQQKDEKSMR
jgi:predicted Zn-dependent protease